MSRCLGTGPHNAGYGVGSRGHGYRAFDCVMRVSDARYSRDLRSFNLAMRMLSQEARTRTISAWTGLSAERVRKLAKLQRRERPQKVPRRPAGPAPRQLATVLTSPSLKTEAATLAGVCHMLKVLPAERVANAKSSLPNVARGERLCTALELFQDLIPHARLTFDQLVMLLNNLAEGDQWEIARCTSCPAMVVADRLTLDRPLCEECQHKSRAAERAAMCKTSTSRVEKPLEGQKLDETEPEGGTQLCLFDENHKGSG
jgi:hypothetical protein